MKRLLSVAAMVMVGGTLTACGGGASGAPEDASVDDFCSTMMDASEFEEDGNVNAEDFADKLKETGTPEDIPDDARDGFEVVVDALADLGNDVSESDFQNAYDDDDFSDDDQENATAFTAYVGETCADQMTQ